MSVAIQEGGIVHPPRGKIRALWRGFVGSCPECGGGRLFRAYLKVNDRCPACGAELHHQRADDAPPYITMFVVAHIVVALLMGSQILWDDAPWWLEAALWSVVTAALSLTLLPRVKGALVGLQWSLRMHGFGDEPRPDRSVVDV